MNSEARIIRIEFMDGESAIATFSDYSAVMVSQSILRECVLAHAEEIVSGDAPDM